MKKYIVIFISTLLLVSITFYSLYNVDNDTKQSITSGDKFYKMLFLKDDKPPLEEIDSNWEYLRDFAQAFIYLFIYLFIYSRGTLFKVNYTSGEHYRLHNRYRAISFNYGEPANILRALSMHERLQTFSS